MVNKIRRKSRKTAFDDARTIGAELRQEMAMDLYNNRGPEPWQVMSLLMGNPADKGVLITRFDGPDLATAELSIDHHQYQVELKRAPKRDD